MSNEALRARFSDLYGIDEARILPVRGALHGKEIVMRFVARNGGKAAAGLDCPALMRLAEIYGLAGVTAPSPSTAVVFSRAGAGQSAPQSAIVVVDESEIEFSDLKSLAGSDDSSIVIRSLESAYDLGEAPCAALIASPSMIAKLMAMVEPNAIPPAIEKAALSVMSPPRLPIASARIARICGERRMLAEGLSRSPFVKEVRELAGPAILVTPADAASFALTSRAWKIAFDALPSSKFKISVGAPEENRRILVAFGAADDVKQNRVGEVARETLETKISVMVDLDRVGSIEIATGIGYFDHMLTQIAHHAGISVTLACCGDLEVDAHHTIEDCAIVFGQALSSALSAHRGIARFGFVLPMDEAEASISIDLGGRPFLVFNGAFKTPLIGAYPTEMTGHFFRSLSQSLAASIHLSVTGENDHHKTEACFKAFGRALRQAIRIEGDAAPSTKGVL